MVCVCSVHSWVSFSAFAEAYFHLTNENNFVQNCTPQNTGMYAFIFHLYVHVSLNRVASYIIKTACF